MTRAWRMRYKGGILYVIFLDCEASFSYFHVSPPLWQRDGGPDGQEEEEENLCLESKSGADTFVPFKGMAALVMSSKQEVTPTAVLSDLSLRSPAAGSASFPISVVAGNHPGSGSVSKCAGRAPPSTAGAHLSLQLQQQRKARRCWSPELHRRFVLALQQLGGAQGQIGFLSYLKYVELDSMIQRKGKTSNFFVPQWILS